MYTEPELDAALLVIKQDEKEKIDLDLDYFDIPAAAEETEGAAGRLGLAFSNCFEIATRDEPMSVQRGVISAYTQARRPPRHLRGALSRRSILLRPDL